MTPTRNPKLAALCADADCLTYDEMLGDALHCLRILAGPVCETCKESDGEIVPATGTERGTPICDAHAYTGPVHSEDEL